MCKAYVYVLYEYVIVGTYYQVHACAYIAMYMYFNKQANLYTNQL